MWQIVISCWSHRKLTSKMFPDFWQSLPWASIKIRHTNSLAVCLCLAWSEPVVHISSVFRTLHVRSCIQLSVGLFTLLQENKLSSFLIILFYFFKILPSAGHVSLVCLAWNLHVCVMVRWTPGEWSNKFTICQCNTDLHQSVYPNWNDQWSKTLKLHWTQLCCWLRQTWSYSSDSFRVTDTHPPQTGATSFTGCLQKCEWRASALCQTDAIQFWFPWSFKFLSPLSATDGTYACNKRPNNVAWSLILVQIIILFAVVLILIDSIYSQYWKVYKKN